MFRWESNLWSSLTFDPGWPKSPYREKKGTCRFCSWCYVQQITFKSFLVHQPASPYLPWDPVLLERLSGPEITSINKTVYISVTLHSISLRTGKSELCYFHSVCTKWWKNTDASEFVLLHTGGPAGPGGPGGPARQCSITSSSSCPLPLSPSTYLGETLKTNNIKHKYYVSIWVYLNSLFNKL